MEIKIRCKGRWDKERELIPLFLLIIKEHIVKRFFPLWLLFILLHSPQLTIMSLYINISRLVKLVTLVESDPKAPFSIATTPRYCGGRYNISWITLIYP